MLKQMQKIALPPLRRQLQTVVDAIFQHHSHSTHSFSSPQPLSGLLLFSVRDQPMKAFRQYPKRLKFMLTR
jgi:hypothetical protein